MNCSEAIDTLACLRTIDYGTLHPFMASSKVSGPGFYPTVDGDILPDFPTQLLRTGQFAHIPHLYGTNSDEGIANAPRGVVNTDDDLHDYLLYDTGFDFPNSTVSRIMELYPDDPSQGVPINTGNEMFPALGAQYKCTLPRFHDHVAIVPFLLPKMSVPACAPFRHPGQPEGQPSVFHS